ncbi:hypothetical protein QN372_00855 [Undibacterium sp. RTI2.1]|uniref:hypothetical protein n=1 Tax=unclassified Undibacterium TaxID=2630295 RepID=UPI002AB39F82|nr:MULTISPECIES: hypothetical protein [unclassified Undibacterium]MDY7537686.1 hypothetical protein [Undibacterium sp. 5I1]MEB0029288.1 hypothetical protein [Undibacterium sp. RTI2.1]MEB0115596.1 hypothetical protein [Undibacterium sp. RTI2.2]MEB0256423.1 hypothetical protein [Undibacterium sp. 5I1]
MTEPELITALTNASVDARASLAFLAQYAGANTDVTLTLSNGWTFTIPGIQKQRAQTTTDFAAQKLAFTQDFGGAISAQTITRNAFGIIQTVRTTFASGYQLQHDYARNTAGQIATITVNIYDALNNVLATVVKNIVRTNGLVTNIN